MEKTGVLALKVVNKTRAFIKFKIESQAEVGVDFGRNGRFRAANGIILQSGYVLTIDCEKQNKTHTGKVKWDSKKGILYVLGIDRKNTVVRMSVKNFAKIEKAVAQYNKRFLIVDSHRHFTDADADKYEEVTKSTSENIKEAAMKLSTDAFDAEVAEKSGRVVVLMKEVDERMCECRKLNEELDILKKLRFAVLGVEPEEAPTEVEL